MTTTIGTPPGRTVIAAQALPPALFHRTTIWIRSRICGRVRILEKVFFTLSGSNTSYSVISVFSSVFR